MLKVRLDSGDVMLGLEPFDVAYIRDRREPILVSLSDIGCEIEVILFYGATREEMLATLQQNGFQFVN